MLKKLLKYLNRERSKPFIYLQKRNGQYGITLRPLIGNPHDVEIICNWLQNAHILATDTDFPRATYIVNSQIYEQFSIKFSKFIFSKE